MIYYLKFKDFCIKLIIKRFKKNLIIKYSKFKKYYLHNSLNKLNKQNKQVLVDF
jgi:hypothetical protein